ncbi:hypothetical protein [Plastoroseomonas hellenica]|uniref:hypothetical protein n=1 Tax=Plastoroseomonas hellenica TaxID=2687306 RepID=UPI001BAB03C1|nr:hypothetical protein [Plastoroseomonas hellenica]MBR0642762.1 hypothetical protein [Plastoroseomonas hellenica]
MAGNVDPTKVMGYVTGAEAAVADPKMNRSKASEITKLYYDTWQKLMKDRQSGQFNADNNIACAEHYAYGRWFVYKDGPSKRGDNAAFLAASIGGYNTLKFALDTLGKIANFGEEPSWSPRQILKIFSGTDASNKGTVSPFDLEQMNWQYKGLTAGYNAPLTPNEQVEIEGE